MTGYLPLITLENDRNVNNKNKCLILIQNELTYANIKKKNHREIYLYS